MRKINLIVALLVTATMTAQFPCDGGSSFGYPCDGYFMQSKLFLAQMDAGDGNDSWGWTDPTSGKEYALVGLDNGTAFIDISDPVNIVYLGKLPTHTSPSIWRDIKVYNNYAFIVSEAGGHGMQVFDLTRLRNVANPPETFTADAHYGQFGNAHNLVINQQTAYAYAVGTSTFSGGAHFIDISDPLNPTPAGGYSGSGYTHDAQVVIYDGPDPDHQGREIYVGSNENEVVIVDVTNKNNPQLLSTINYGSVDYTHQSWLTEDLSYLLIGDELDENAFGFNTRTIIADVSDLDAPFYFFQYFGNIASIDHNGYVKGNRYYLANYSGGMRVIDISNIANQQMTEIGYFDTFPANDNVNFNGTWNVYPFFESGNIVISGEGGFTLVKSENFSLDDQTLETFTMSPTPTKDFVTLRSKKQPISSIEVHNLLGQKVMSTQLFDQQEVRLDVSHLTSGIYLVTVDNKQSLKLVID